MSKMINDSNEVNDSIEQVSFDIMEEQVRSIISDIKHLFPMFDSSSKPKYDIVSALQDEDSFQVDPVGKEKAANLIGDTLCDESGKLRHTGFIFNFEFEDEVSLDFIVCYYELAGGGRHYVFVCNSFYMPSLDDIELNLGDSHNSFIVLLDSIVIRPEPDYIKFIEKSVITKDNIIPDEVSYVCSNSDKHVIRKRINHSATDFNNLVYTEECGISFEEIEGNDLSNDFYFNKKHTKGEPYNEVMLKMVELADKLWSDGIQLYRFKANGFNKMEVPGTTICIGTKNSTITGNYSFDTESSVIMLINSEIDGSDIINYSSGIGYVLLDNVSLSKDAGVNVPNESIGLVITDSTIEKSRFNNVEQIESSTISHSIVRFDQVGKLSNCQIYYSSVTPACLEVYEETNLHDVNLWRYNAEILVPYRAGGDMVESNITLSIFSINTAPEDLIESKHVEFDRGIVILSTSNYTAPTLWYFAADRRAYARESGKWD